MVPNPAYQHISALDLADACMVKNPAYMPIQPWQRQHMTICQACTTEPSPAVQSRPLPCPPELEEKRKQRQLRHKIKPATMPLLVAINSTSIVHGHGDSYMDEPVPVQTPIERDAHREEVCTVIVLLNSYHTYNINIVCVLHAWVEFCSCMHVLMEVSMYIICMQVP